MTTKLDRNRPSAHWDGHTLTVRASAQADCRRALWYAATGHEPTNPPDEVAQVRMDAGNALESVVIRAMRRAGWQTTNYAEARRNVDVRVELAPGLVIEGTPDARGIAPDAKETGYFGHPLHSLVEVKTYGHSRYRHWQSMRTEGMNPSAMMQAGIYRQGLRVLGEIDTDAPVVFANLDTDTREWDYEIVTASRMAEWTQLAYTRLTELRNDLLADRLPEPEYNPGDWQCRSCPFLTVCGNVEPEPAGPARTAAEFADAVRGFQIADVNGDEKGKKAERQSMAAYLVESELPRLTVEQDGMAHTVSLRTTPKTDVDLPLLATLLSREDYARVVSYKESHTVAVKSEPLAQPEPHQVYIPIFGKTAIVDIHGIISAETPITDQSVWCHCTYPLSAECLAAARQQIEQNTYTRRMRLRRHSLRRRAARRLLRQPQGGIAMDRRDEILAWSQCVPSF